MKWLLSLLLVAGIVWFSIPAAVGIVNIGNFSGIAICTFLLLWFYSYPFFKQLAEKNGHLQGFCWGNRILGGVFCVGAVWIVVLTAGMVKAAFSMPAENATVVVLGSQVHGTEPSLDLWERIRAAEQWLKANPKAVCIASGGQGKGEDASEAAVIRDKLVQLGISTDRIYLEDSSVNTRENLKNSKEIIQKNRLSPQLAIVTDEYHQLRASIIAKKAGLTPSAICAATPWHIFSACYARELLAITAELIF